jgi:hypothetical protein
MHEKSRDVRLRESRSHELGAVFLRKKVITPMWKYSCLVDKCDPEINVALQLLSKKE